MTYLLCHRFFSRGYSEVFVKRVNIFGKIAADVYEANQISIPALDMKNDFDCEEN